MSDDLTSQPDLSVDVGGLRLASPVMGAAGCCGFGRDLIRLGRAADLAALVTPSMTLRAEQDHSDTLVEAASGLVTAMHRSTLGVEELNATRLPWGIDGLPPVVVSLAGDAPGAYAEVADRLRRQSLMRAVAAVELDLARPDRTNGGTFFAHDPEAARRATSRAREQLPREVPLWAKLSADVPNLVEVAHGCVRSGATALVVTSPLRAVALDQVTLRPRVAPEVGGLSGPAILPVTLRAVWVLRRAILEGRLPHTMIVAVGGISRAQDAVHAMAVGAVAVQLGTAMLHDPSSASRITAGLAAECVRRDLPSVHHLVGCAHDED